MFNRFKTSAFAVLLVLAGCTAAILVPQDAVARGQRAQVQRARTTFVRPRAVQHVAVARRSSQPRQAVFRHTQVASRPVVAQRTTRMVQPTALPRANTMSLSRPRNAAPTLPHANAIAGGISHTNSTGLSGPHIATEGSGASSRFTNPSTNTQTRRPTPPAFAAAASKTTPFRSNAADESTSFVTSDTGFTDAQKPNPKKTGPVFVPPPPVPKAIQAAQLGEAQKNAPVFVPPPKAIQAAQLAAAQKQNNGTAGSATAGQQQVKCIVAPCPKHVPPGQIKQPTGQGSNTPGQTQQPTTTTTQNKPPKQTGNKGDGSGSGNGNAGGGGGQSASDPTIGDSGNATSADAGAAAGSVAQAPAQVATLQDTPQTGVATTARTFQGGRPAATVRAPRFVFVAFQQNISAADLAVFLQAYNVSVVGLPTSSGYYKLRIADDYPANQMRQLLDSMKSQTAFVSDAIAG